MGTARLVVCAKLVGACARSSTIARPPSQTPRAPAARLLVGPVMLPLQITLQRSAAVSTPRRCVVQVLRFCTGDPAR